MDNVKTTLSREDSIDIINSLVADQVEYECSHKDSGDGYYHLVGESWDDSIDGARLLDDLQELKRDSTVTDHFSNKAYKPQWCLLIIDGWTLI